MPPNLVVLYHLGISFFVFMWFSFSPRLRAGGEFKEQRFVSLWAGIIVQWYEVYWLVLCVNLTHSRVLREEMPP